MVVVVLREVEVQAPIHTQLVFDHFLDVAVKPSVQSFDVEVEVVQEGVVVESAH
jgi:hypothetical protein